jgi:hypothetical protein
MKHKSSEKIAQKISGLSAQQELESWIILYRGVAVLPHGRP